MPTTNEILAGLREITNDGFIAAILWHLAIAFVLAALAAGWRPRRHLALLLLAAPLVSVAGFALVHRNPFNWLVMSAGVILLVERAVDGDVDDGRVVAGPRWATALGMAAIAYAWSYPHFVDGGSPLTYLYAAPVGLVPCPSLALVLGFALLGGGIDRRAAGILAVLGIFYSVFGAVRLGVWLDVGLAAGAVGAAGLALGGTGRTHAAA